MLATRGSAQTAGGAAAGALSVAILDSRVSAWMGRIRGIIDQQRQQLLTGTNLLLENRIAQADLALQNLVSLADEKAQSRIRELDGNAQLYIAQVEALAQGLAEGLGANIDRLALASDIALQQACDASAFCEKAPTIRAVANTVVSPTRLGSHFVDVTGSIFLDSIATTVRVNGQALRSRDHHRTGEATRYRIEIPKSLVTAANDSLRRVDLQITVTRWRRSVLTDLTERRYVVSGTQTYRVPLYVLPLHPVRVRLEAEYDSTTWVPCDSCKAVRRFQIDGTMRWSDEIPLAEHVSLDSAISWDWWRQAQPAGRDYYWLICRRPVKETVNERSQRVVPVSCLNAYIRQEGNSEVQRRINSSDWRVRESVIDMWFPKWQWTPSRTTREVSFTLQYKRRSSALAVEPLALRDGSRTGSTAPRRLSFAEHWSVPYESSRRVTMIVEPLFDRGAAPLRLRVADGEETVLPLGSIARLRVARVTIGNTTELRIRVEESPALR
ncbi:hypothetical protein [Gemmatimonas sp.]|uniref:hypothetical protein n=1 Tax=Gemmatimonas sp. TaxID=1962908 RepID=UPI00333E5F31